MIGTISVLGVFSVVYVSRCDYSRFFFFLMIRRPPRSTQSRSSAASDVYKRQFLRDVVSKEIAHLERQFNVFCEDLVIRIDGLRLLVHAGGIPPVSYTHLRAHETVLDIVCRLLLEKKK